MPLQEDACNQSPAHAPNAITVAATNVSDGISWFSNFGPCVDLFAPGVGLQSAWLNNTYITLSGMLVLSVFSVFR
jgi:subtilisin family serine protease